MWMNKNEPTKEDWIMAAFIILTFLLSILKLNLIYFVALCMLYFVIWLVMRNRKDS